MSDELDKKLGEIIDSHYFLCEGDGEVHLNPHTGNVFIDEIKQAFIDAGWEDSNIQWNFGGKTDSTNNILPPVIKKMKHYMTQEEWEAKAIKDGWIHVSASQETQAAIANTMLGNKVMTGQEWFCRFEKELRKRLGITKDNRIMCSGCSCDALDAAEKASGIS